MLKFYLAITAHNGKDITAHNGKGFACTATWHMLQTEYKTFKCSIRER